MRKGRPSLWPAYLRAVLFFLSTSISSALAQADKLTYEQIVQFTWWDWGRFWGPVLVIGIGTWIAFIDQTMTRLNQEQARHDSIESQVSKTETVTVTDSTPTDKK